MTHTDLYKTVDKSNLYYLAVPTTTEFMKIIDVKETSSLFAFYTIPTNCKNIERYIQFNGLFDEYKITLDLKKLLTDSRSHYDDCSFHTVDRHVRCVRDICSLLVLQKQRKQEERLHGRQRKTSKRVIYDEIVLIYC